MHDMTAKDRSQFRVKLPAEQLKQLSVRSDWQGWCSLLAHIALIAAAGAACLAFYQQQYFLLAWLCLLLYGVFFSFLGWAGLSHELSHNTVFKSRLVNQILLKLISFLLWNNQVYFRYSHAIHHHSTLQTGVDFEVRLPVKFSKPLMFLGFFTGVVDFYRVLSFTINNSLNRLDGPLAQSIFAVGEQKRQDLVLNARLIILGHISLMILFYLLNLPELIVLVCFGNFIAPSFSKVFGLSQHCGMQSDVADMRLSTRTILLPRFFAFLYWNMNYHIEHHMYPSIPFYQLPQLHQQIKTQTPEPEVGVARLFQLVFAPVKVIS